MRALPGWAPLAAITALAALLRLSTLGSRSLWLDEGAEWHLMRMGFGRMLSGVIHGEVTPPLSYCLEWLATRAVGSSETGLRLLFAVLGIALVPLVYALGRELASRRAGLVAAALAATNPLLVWHAQDARAYTLLVVLLAASTLVAARGRLWWWGLLAVLALATHYVAVFVLAPQAARLLWRHRRAAVAPVAIAAAALVPLVVLTVSQDNALVSAWIGHTSLIRRLAEVPAGFLVGYQVALPAAALITAAALVPVAAGVWLARGSDAGQALLALSAASLALPIVVALVGQDFVIVRSVIGSLVPLLVAVATGLGHPLAWRWGAPAAAALCVAWAGVSLATATDPKFRREDWRGAVHAARGADAMLAVPPTGRNLLEYYGGGALARAPRATVRELAVVLMGQSSGFGCSVPSEPAAVPRGAVRRTVRSGRCWRVVRYRYPAPTVVAGSDGALVTR